ncbi:MAG TPA: hypothetical protein VJ824_17250 [Bacillota bacterium]|nr:hypothetical protein [Bacillota bacterium]
MKQESKVQEMIEKLRVKDLDFQSNQITFINDGKITFLNLASDKMDTLKELCVGKMPDELLFPIGKKTLKSSIPPFKGSLAYGDDVVITIKDVILNYL